MAVKNQSTVRTKWRISQGFRRQQKETNIRFIETVEELQPTQKCGNNFITHAPSNQPRRYEECISCWNKRKKCERVLGEESSCLPKWWRITMILLLILELPPSSGHDARRFYYDIWAMRIESETTISYIIKDLNRRFTLMIEKNQLSRIYHWILLYCSRESWKTCQI